MIVMLYLTTAQVFVVVTNYAENVHVENVGRKNVNKVAHSGTGV